MICGTGGLTKIGKGLKTAEDIKKAKKIAKEAKVIEVKTTQAAVEKQKTVKGMMKVKKTVTAKKTISYKRPSHYRKGMREKVWEKAKRKGNGKVIDPVSSKEIKKTDSWDMGHKPGFEFKKHQQSAKKRGISRKKFLDEYNDPNHYRPEMPSSNRSHAGENHSDIYYGP